MGTDFVAWSAKFNCTIESYDVMVPDSLPSTTSVPKINFFGTDIFTRAGGRAMNNDIFNVHHSREAPAEPERAAMMIRAISSAIVSHFLGFLETSSICCLFCSMRARLAISIA